MLARRGFLQAAALAAVLPMCKTSSALAQTSRYGFLSTTWSAEAGFVYGLPLVVSYATMYEQAIDPYSRHFKAALNRIKNEDRVFTADDANVDLPNNDTARSFAWIDLRAEPVVLSVPAVDANRYYAIMLRDGRFYDYGYVGSRATGCDAGDYLVVGPDWNGQVPSNIKKVFRSSTQFSLALFRTRLFDPDDVDNVRRVQAGFRMETLSSYRHETPSELAQIIDFQIIRKKLLRKNFFQHLAFALQFAPAGSIEAGADANLAKLGVGPGRTFDFRDLSPKEKLEIVLGIKLGDHKIDRTIADADVMVNGWRIAPYFGDSAFYNGNWPLRAAAAKEELYGNDPRETVLALTQVDDNGRRLDGRRHDYILTFARDQLPPVNAFWSLTMYDGRSRSLIANPIDRYLVNSSMLPTMKMDANGGFTIYIQHRPPGSAMTANWLPAPDGTMLLGMRLYWPRAEPPSILPIGKGGWRPPSVKRVR